MASKSYTATDYAACRYVRENYRGTVGTPLSLDAATVDRLRLLRLADGAPNETQSGDLVRLSGLGQKTGAEAVRFGIAALS